MKPKLLLAVMTTAALASTVDAQEPSAAPTLSPFIAGKDPAWTIKMDPPVLTMRGLAFKPLTGGYERPEHPEELKITLYTKDGQVWTAKWEKVEAKK